MLERILWFLIALVLLALALFFVTAAIVVGAVVGVALIARIWWINRKIRKAAKDRILTTEYTVVEREAQSPQQQLSADGQGKEPSAHR